MPLETSLPVWVAHGRSVDTSSEWPTAESGENLIVNDLGSGGSNFCACKYSTASWCQAISCILIRSRDGYTM